IVLRQMGETFAINAVPPTEIAKELVIDTTPLLWIGVLACLAYPAVPARVRIFALILFGLQATLIWLFLTHSTRFLGGIPHALWITAAMMAPSAGVRPASSPVRVAL